MISLASLLELAAIVVAGTLVGSELAVAVFVHPRLSALDDATHVRAVSSLAAVFGRAMPFWYALALLLSGVVAFLARPSGTPGHGLALAATVLFAVIIVYSVLLPVPINSQVARWQPDSLPSNWRALRRRWDALHSVRVGALLVALVLLIAACLVVPAV